RSKRGINTLRKKKLSNKTAAQRCVWRFYTVTLKNSLNRRFPSLQPVYAMSTAGNRLIETLSTAQRRQPVELIHFLTGRQCKETKIKE
ncbi:MAG: hypothetical protein ACK53F_09750, partial [Betaproteobacteria bacterium]